MYESRAPGFGIAGGKRGWNHAIQGPSPMPLLAQLRMLLVKGETKRPTDVDFVDRGKAVTAPYCPGKGVPSGRPIHTPTVWPRVVPIAQASRKP